MDSYAVNAQHGLRRSVADIEIVVQRALRHPRAGRLSNNQIARHLGHPRANITAIETKAIFVM